jgi:serine/threonine-protein kinase
MPQSPVPASSGTTPENVRAQLDRVLASGIFTSSQRLSKFLRFVVERTIADRSDEIKEYSLGLEVFERDADFDPRIDPIVRVQAAKLRSKLTEYYSGEGREDALIISIPKGGYAAVFTSTAAPPKNAGQEPRASVAVLPFVNMSGEPDNEYFSDGLTEEVINVLTNIPGLQVVARTSAFRFKGENHDIREIGKQLNAGAVLEGSVRRAGVHLRITAQLINVESGYHLWSQTFKREMKDIFEIQEEISGAVRDALAPLFGGAAAEEHLTPKQYRPNSRAHDLYLRGRYAQARRIRGSVSEGLHFFEEAIAADSEYARAYSGLADAWFLLAFWGVVPPHTAMPKAKAAALKALELDGRLPEAHASLGVIQTSYEWQREAGKRSILRALELDPDYAPAYQALAAQVLLPSGEIERAIEIQRKAISLDSLSPSPQGTLTFFLGLSGRISEAISHHESALSTNPSYFFFHSSMAIAYAANGMTAEAVAEITKGFEASRRHPSILSGMAYFHAINGDQERAQEFLRQALEARETAYIPAVEIAAAYAGFRDRQQTLAWLERALEERSIQLFFVNMDPRYRWLHNDPKFAAILRHLDLPAGRLPGK